MGAVMSISSPDSGNEYLVKPPAVAGLFYPDSAQQLRQDVAGYLAESEPREDIAPQALIAPHAGYIYSGPVAASAYRQLKLLDHPVERVVMLGPAHRVGFQGIAMHSADYFETPLGRVSLDREAVKLLTHFPFVNVVDSAFAQEHSLEVQLPFLQQILGPFKLVPMLVGQSSYQQVDQVLEHISAGANDLIVISTDLSHYHHYEQAKEMDIEAGRAIEALEPDRLQFEHACGRIPVGGLLLYAKRHGLKAITLDQRNSGDTAGSHDQVVGYGAYAFV